MRTKLPTRTQYRQFFRALFGHVARGLVLASLAGALSAAGAAAMLHAVPHLTARVAGTLYCADQSAAGLLTVEGPHLRTLHAQAPDVQLQARALTCAAGQGTPLRADLAWYATWAAGAGGLVALLYAMLTITSVLAFPPSPADPHALPSEDLPALFLAECCDLAPKQRAAAPQLNAAYAAWSRAKGHRPPASKTLAREWKRLGLRPRGFLRTSAWRGARLKM